MNNISDVVLVVDDSPESLGMLNVALNTQGFTALVALNGIQALAIVEKVKPDVVLLDAVMPEMDGFETCKRLKKILPNTPIIFMTGLTEIDDVVKGFDAGGIDYVTKPISPDEVIARIKTHIQTAKLALSAQSALDRTGSNTFCVSPEGRLSWATPNVHQFIEKICGKDTSPWASISTKLAPWLQSSDLKESAILTINCFLSPLPIQYLGIQDSYHLLKVVEPSTSKTSTYLQENLPITKRESEVLYWISFGKTSWEISQILDISPRTANKHLEQIYKKLGVDNKTSAAAIALRLLER
ncbi:DNA-binding response regulator [Alteromonas sp. KS69]|jgi:DNA-binding NarL/FixJ family response regulator|uniref:Two-component response regulator n=1 Tax=Alteromonas naphthalenivorans TaxID=715451 RepID=F5Z6W6_ALTNA|nr:MULTISPECIES: DNA-binding response regulator [Alteromonas]AEF05629.1 two-component response regulator [Alteromonas naphthalenivorans]RUP75156.1 DNA-binding response regulator [Alteromonas sp. KS69]|tara:strand:- start:6700 stop:7593 length:894 start_codon:yes stop_codon:yes gene_type:complete